MKNQSRNHHYNNNKEDNVAKSHQNSVGSNAQQSTMEFFTVDQTVVNEAESIDSIDN
jgi:hypothetical protein